MAGSHSRLVLHLVCAALAGCGGSTCQGVNANVSVPAASRNDPDIAHQMQTETSMVRVDDPRSPPSAQSRIVVAYVDESTRNGVSVQNGRAWTNGASLDGWAYSDDSGSTWHARPQLSTPSSLQFLLGNSYLAAYGTTVLWTSLALGPDASDIPISLINPVFNYLIIDRMRNSGSTNPNPQFEPVQILAGPFDEAHAVDGPKIAIIRDGNAAMVVWQLAPDGIVRPIANYKLLTDFEGSTLRIPDDSHIGTVAPADFASAPVGCFSYKAATHPIVAGGSHDLYVAMQFSVNLVRSVAECSTGFYQPYFSMGVPLPYLIEVYRFKLATQHWDRIMSVVAPQFGGMVIGLMNGYVPPSASNINHSTRVGARPTLTVSRSNGHDVVLVATEKEEKAHDNPAVMDNEKVVLWRLPDADICAPSSDDGKSCGDQVLQSVEVDQGQPVVLGKPAPQPAMAPPGAWEYQPALYNGFGSGGDLEDSRVGVIWYSQPYAGDAVESGKDAWTIVEGMWSNDAGLSFHGPLNFTLAAKELPSVYPSDKVLGQYFVPCQQGSDGYFGDYISGVFSRHDIGSTDMVSTWADSRQGCISQGTSVDGVYHQHVYSGNSTPQLVEEP